MMAKFGDKESLELGRRVPIGFYKYNGPTPIFLRGGDLETAASSSKIEIPVGIYPIYPGWKGDKENGEAILYVELRGKSTQEYSPNKTQVEDKCTTSRLIDVVHAVQQTGKTPHKAKDSNGNIPADFFIDPQYLPDILSYYKQKLKNELLAFKKIINPISEDLLKITSNVRYASSRLQEYALPVEVVGKMIEDLKVPGFYASVINNTAWAKEQPPQQKDINPRRSRHQLPNLGTDGI